MELYQRIEQLIDKKLTLYPTVEEEVLGLMERVSEAQRYARMVRGQAQGVISQLVYIYPSHRKFKALLSTNDMLRVILMMVRRKARLRRKGENSSMNNATIFDWCCVSCVVTVLKVSQASSSEGSSGCCLVSATRRGISSPFCRSF